MKKIVKISRIKAGIMSTLGKLYVDNIFLCYVLEDVVRPHGVKIPKFTALPEGIFRLVIRFSPSKKRKLWTITNNIDNVTVEANGISFMYTMLHGGVDHSHTDGCPLIGKTLISDKVASNYDSNNRLEFLIKDSAEEELNKLLDENEEHTIIIQNEF